MPLRALVLTISVLTGCAIANAGNLPSAGPAEDQSVEFVVLNGPRRPWWHSRCGTPGDQL